ncbi:MAG: S1C family serine protease [Sedimentisphaerales bacterium]
MKLRNVSLMFLAVLFAVSVLLYAESESPTTRTFLGARLDKRPLPDFLAKHLGLSPGQGFRIINLHRDGPAHQAGLERDDILIGFQGEDVTDPDGFVDAIRQSSPGDEVTLEIIHLGKRKTVKVKLGLFEGRGEYDWVYSKEQPQMIRYEIIRPGGAYRKDKEGWVRVPLDQIPRKVALKVAGDSKEGTIDLLNEVYSYSYFDGDRNYTITIVGNPNDKDAEVYVRISDTKGDTNYETTVGRIEKLPKGYRAIAEGALQDARKSSQKTDLEHQLHFRKSYTTSSPSYTPASQFGPGEEILDRIEKHMRELQQRLENLEKLQEKMLQQLSDELKKAKSMDQGRKEQKV